MEKKNKRDVKGRGGGSGRCPGVVTFEPLETRRRWLKQKKVRTRKLAKARPGYRHARNSSGGGGVRAKSHRGAANREQDGNASDVCSVLFPRLNVEREKKKKKNYPVHLVAMIPSKKYIT